MDIRISCPICGQAEVGNLPSHLQSHSKQSLIDILLVQHQQIRKQHTAPNSNPAVPVLSKVVDSSPVAVAKAPNDNAGGTGSSQILLEFQSESNDTDDEGNNEAPVKIKKDLSTFPTPGLRARKTVQTSSMLNNADPAPNSSPETEGLSSQAHSPKPSSIKELIKVETTTISVTNGSEPEAIRRGISCRKPTFVLVDHGHCKPGPSRKTNSGDVNNKLRTDNSSDVTSAPGTSIIQYIIDESGQINDSPQEEADNWILADGRTIPVYSSLTQVPAVSDNTPTCTMTVDISNKDHEAETIPITVEQNVLQGQMHLNLMTDEEIPPRGEISEYEESNASSIMSEDSNIRPVGILSDPRRSPIIHEQNVFLSRKKKSPKAALHQQYVCYECPQVQVFCSLFELAEHKFESHQNKMGSNNVPVTFSTDQNSVHILPEKIRRQSRDDQLEMDIPLQDPLADIPNEVVVPAASTSSTSAKKEYFCVYCSFTSKKKSLLASHMETDHAGKPRTPNMFECTHCGKIFQARTNLRKHLLIHKERKYSCPTCFKGFTSNFKLTEHIRVHTKNYPYKCTSCDKTYRTISLLNHHMKMVHLPEGERPPKRKLEFYCGICHRVLHSKRSYANHILLHQEKPIKCSFCSETFQRHSVLVRHIRIAHDPKYESKESKDCPVCQKKLHPNSMIKHMRIHANEKPYSCNVCGKFFRTYANLTSHSWSHTNVDKPHKCRQCSKSYLFKKNLENHMMVHKKRTMHFVCNECGVKFTHKVNMKRHLEEHFKEKNHVCKVCGKAFQRNYYLIEHERIHSGVKPFTCNICGKASTTKSNHRAHLKIHDARETGNQEG